jgi:hypothetical protein
MMEKPTISRKTVKKTIPRTELLLEGIWVV